MIRKHLWLLSETKAQVLLILLSFVASIQHGRKAKLQLEVSENKEVIFSLQVEAPERNRMHLQEDSALSSPWETLEGESPWMSGQEISGENGSRDGEEFGHCPWNRDPREVGL